MQVRFLLMGLVCLVLRSPRPILLLPPAFTTRNDAGSIPPVDPALLALKYKAEEIGNELVDIRKMMAMLMNRFDDLPIDLGHHERSIADML